MSRVIEVSDPSKLSEADRKYLQDRGRLPEGAAPVRVRPPASSPLEETAYTGDVGASPPRAGAQFEDEEIIADDYDDMGIGALRKQAKSRGLEATGTKDDIIERLRDDDNDVVGPEEGEDEESEEEGQ
jgi:hypothetical protein